MFHPLPSVKSRSASPHLTRTTAEAQQQHINRRRRRERCTGSPRPFLVFFLTFLLILVCVSFIVSLFLQRQEAEFKSSCKAQLIQLQEQLQKLNSSAISGGGENGEEAEKMREIEALYDAEANKLQKLREGPCSKRRRRATRGTARLSLSEEDERGRGRAERGKPSLMRKRTNFKTSRRPDESRR